MSTTATKTKTTVKATAKRGQTAKAKAEVVTTTRPEAPQGFTQAQPMSAKKAGAQPSEYYPQGNVTIRLLPKAARMGRDQQANWDAIHAALGGKPEGSLATALAKDNTKACTRRHVRRLARSGYLVWRA